MWKIVIAVIGLTFLASLLYLGRNRWRTYRQNKGRKKRISEIRELETHFEKRSDKELQELTSNFRSQLNEGTPLDDVLVPAFAAVCVAAKRVLKISIVDVQLMGGIVLHEGKISEMNTGEGKTLVAILPAYLNALSGQGVHVVTINEYLAERDAAWVRPVFAALDITVGINLLEMSF